MGQAIYQIVFSGKIIEGHNVAQVKKNMATLFKKTPEQVEALFSGKPVVIKKDADKETAAKYQAILKKAGAVCQVLSNAKSEPGKDTPKPAATPQANTQQASGSAQASAGGKKVRMLRATRDDVNLEVPNDFGGLSIAEAGVTLVEPQSVAEFKIEGIESLSLSELGVLLAEPNNVSPQVIEDMSGLELESLDEGDEPSSP